MSSASDFIVENGVLTKYVGPGGDVVIPDGVTEIGSSAFLDCITLTSVTIREGVTKICWSAFNHCTSLTKVTIPDSVTHLGQSAFRGCVSLKSVRLPANIAIIEAGTFGGCDLSDVQIPDGVTSIGNNAFSCNPNLKTVSIPCGVTDIGVKTFADCRSLTNVMIPEGVESIGDGAFEGCSRLTSVTIPESLRSIGDGAFTKTALTKNITGWENDILYLSRLLLCAKKTIKGVCEIRQGTLYIESEAFSGCGDLTRLTIPDSVVSIGTRAFHDCGSLQSIILSKNLKTISSSAFAFCRSLENVTIPEGVKSIGERAFENCHSLTSIVIPDSVKSIGPGAFVGCSSLKSVTIPDSAYPHFQSAPPPFSGCKLAVTVRHWSPETSVLFNGCGITAIHTEEIAQVPTKYRGLAAVGFAAEKPTDLTTTRAAEHMAYIKRNGGKLCESIMTQKDALYFLCEQKLIGPKDIDTYLEATDKWNDPELIAMLLNYQNSFGFKALTEVRMKKEKKKGTDFDTRADRIALLDPVKSIKGVVFVITGKTFKQWESRKEIQTYLESFGAELAASVTKKTDYLVTEETDNCSEKSRKAKEYGVQIINEAAFNDMIGRRFKDAQQITIPAWLKEIRAYACQDCESLTSVEIPEGVQSIGERAFENCRSLTSIIIPDSVKSIGPGAFENCHSLTSIIIPDSVKSIGAGSFSGCGSLTKGVILNDKAHIFDGAFSGCEKLETAGPLGGGYDLEFAWEDKIPHGTFWDCIGLKRITIPDKATSIGNWAFRACKSLTEVVIPDKVTTIGDYAFSDCSSLTSVTIPASVTTIGNAVFSGCPRFTIHAPLGSFAEKYAKKKRIPFMAE